MPLAIDPTEVIGEELNLGSHVANRGRVGLIGLLGSFGEDFFGCLDS